MLYVVILAYNEESSLPGILSDLNQSLKQQKEPFQIVVVDDGSQDGTSAAVQAFASKMLVVLLKHPVNRGVAQAFNTGLRYAVQHGKASDWVITMEGDKTNDPLAVSGMLAKLREGYDVVCASRYQRGGGYVGFPLKRYVLSVGANRMAQLLFRVPGVRDYTLFFRGYRMGVLQRAVERYGDRFIECRGFSSNAEILVKVYRAGFIRCGEIPTVYRYDLKRGKSKMKVWRNILEYFRLYGIFLKNSFPS